MSDDIKDKDDDKEIDGDIEVAEGELEGGSAEPSFAPTAVASAFDEEDDASADPHSSFDEHATVAEDPHQEDIYGDAGAPAGYNEEEEEEEEDNLEEDY